MEGCDDTNSAAKVVAVCYERVVTENLRASHSVFS